MKQPKIFLTLFSLLLLCLVSTAQATIFDAPDFLAPKDSSVSGMGEILLSDPTSEGLEVHGRHGLSEDWNVGAVVGGGTKNKKFRIGGEGVYSIIPDAKGQFGVSALGSAMLLNRDGAYGMQLRLGALGSKRYTAWNDLPGLLYVALPVYFEVRSGHYTTGSHIVVGSLVDLTSDHRFYAGGELGVRIAKVESYLLAGAGLRFGELKIQVEEKDKPARDSSGKNRDSSEKEYRSEDFQK